MKVADTSKRLKEIMASQNLKQVDILEKALPYCKQYDIKLTKVDLSQYVSGKVEPGQAKLFVLANALNVNEAWLMGFDVPMHRDIYEEDPNIVRFDQELENAVRIIENAGYSLSFSDPPNEDALVVKNKANSIIACMHDFELVNMYEYIQRKGDILDATRLLGLDNDLHCYSKIYSIPKPGSAGYVFSDVDNRLTDIIYSYERLNGIGKEKAYDYVMDLVEQSKYLSAKIQNNKIVTSTEKAYLEPQAAHERTDIGVTDEMRKHDDDIMDDDKFWNK